jgi:hypothetical protein
LAIAIPSPGPDAAHPRLDAEHYSNLLCLASAGTRAAVVGPWLDYAAGIRVRGRGWCNHGFTPDQPIHRSRMPNGAVESGQP